MDLPDLTTLTDDDLRDLGGAVTGESDRRSALADLPWDVTSRAAFYLRAGGDPQVLHDAIDAATTTEGA